LSWVIVAVKQRSAHHAKKITDSQAGGKQKPAHHARVLMVKQRASKGQPATQD